MFVIVNGIYDTFFYFCYSRRDKSSYSITNKPAYENVQIKPPAVYEVPDLKRYNIFHYWSHSFCWHNCNSSTDDIEMKECEPYGLHQTPHPQSVPSDERHIYEPLQQQ